MIEQIFSFLFTTIWGWLIIALPCVYFYRKFQKDKAIKAACNIDVAAIENQAEIDFKKLLKRVNDIKINPTEGLLKSSEQYLEFVDNFNQEFSERGLEQQLLKQQLRALQDHGMHYINNTERIQGLNSEESAKIKKAEEEQNKIYSNYFNKKRSVVTTELKNKKEQIDNDIKRLLQTLTPYLSKNMKPLSLPGEEDVDYKYSPFPTFCAEKGDVIFLFYKNCVVFVDKILCITNYKDLGLETQEIWNNGNWDRYIKLFQKSKAISIPYHRGGNILSTLSECYSACIENPNYEVNEVLAQIEERERAKREERERQQRIREAEAAQRAADPTYYAALEWVKKSEDHLNSMRRNCNATDKLTHYQAITKYGEEITATQQNLDKKIGQRNISQTAREVYKNYLYTTLLERQKSFSEITL